MSKDEITVIEATTFAQANINERDDLQRLLRNKIEIVAPHTMVIAEEFCDWEDSRRRIDLLAIDKAANLVVIELKRTESGGHMELQAVRYAAMVSALTFDKAVETFERYMGARDDSRDARQTILDFLEWDEPNEDDFGSDVRIVLASAEFSKELTSSVLWLCDHGVDIRCVRLRPHGTADNLLLDVQQIIPLPEAEDYQVRVRSKHQKERAARQLSRDTTRYNVTIAGQVQENLSKRKAVLALVQGLCQSGVAPDQIAAKIHWKTKIKIFQSTDGNMRSEEFVSELKRQDATFRADKYFTDDDELIHYDGKTFAFTNRWGPRAAEAMKILIDAFAPTNISFKPA